MSEKLGHLPAGGPHPHAGTWWPKALAGASVAALVLLFLRRRL